MTRALLIVGCCLAVLMTHAALAAPPATDSPAKSPAAKSPLPSSLSGKPAPKVVPQENTSSRAPRKPAPAAKPIERAPATDDAAPAETTAEENNSADSSAATGKSTEKYLLRYKFAAGEKVRWRVIHRATIKTTIQGTSQTAWTSSDSIKVWEVDQVTDEGAIAFTHSVESVKMVNQISGRAKVEWDSANGEEAPAGFQDAAKAVGVPLTAVEMSDRGEVLKREEKFEQKQSEDNPIAIPLPQEEVAIGHVWLEPHDVKLLLKGGGTKAVNARRRFELKSVDNGVAKIAIDYQVLTPLRDPFLESQLVQRLTKGEARFDLERGRIISQQHDIDKRLHEFSGPASLMHYLMRFTEALQDESTPPEAKVAKQPAKETADEPAKK